MQKVFILAFLLICITAKRHSFDTKACVQKKCKGELEACDSACFDTIRSCAPAKGTQQSEASEKKIVGCLKKNPASFAFINCVVEKNCAPQKEKELSDETMEHLMNYARLFA